MITLYLSDGLGNQMFQYACARAIQIHTNNKLRFSLSKFSSDNAGRKYALGSFNINGEIKIMSGMKSSIDLCLLKMRLRLPFAGVPDPHKGYIGKNIIWGEPIQVYNFLDYTNKEFGRNLRIYGQFQNPKYFEQYSGVIKSELTVKTVPSKANQAFIDQISATNSVCVHVRRGDYLDGRWQHLNVCNYEYYLKAMKRVSEKTENPVFYIFSNSHSDIEWIKENYNFDEFNVEYVDLENPDYEELRLMYSCRHFIISNSTFSWWAQYLGACEEKVVVAPSVWNKKLDDYTGLYLPGWDIIEV